ncbi:MAG: hypothetical protein IJD61_05260, partial [Clostridia bacterium]|nr:hypothetical protein [Clostridia bacterium]
SIPQKKKRGGDESTPLFRCLFRFCKNEMIEQQNPNQIQPTEYDTGRNGYENRKNQRNQALRFESSRPTDADFDNPARNGDQKENHLHQFALLIEPFSHKRYLRNFFPFLLRNGFIKIIITQILYLVNTYKKIFLPFFPCPENAPVSLKKCG